MSEEECCRIYCDTRPESQNSTPRARCLLISNDWVNTKFLLQWLAKTRFCSNEYAPINQTVSQRLSHISMATGETE